MGDAPRSLFEQLLPQSGEPIDPLAMARRDQRKHLPQHSTKMRVPENTAAPSPCCSMDGR